MVRVKGILITHGEMFRLFSWLQMHILAWEVGKGFSRKAWIASYSRVLSARALNNSASGAILLSARKAYPVWNARTVVRLAEETRTTLFPSLVTSVRDNNSEGRESLWQVAQ